MSLLEIGMTRHHIITMDDATDRNAPLNLGPRGKIVLVWHRICRWLHGCLILMLLLAGISTFALKCEWPNFRDVESAAPVEDAQLQCPSAIEERVNALLSRLRD